jgi:TPR repeat protein
VARQRMPGFLSIVVLSALLFTGLFASHTNAEPMPNVDGSVEQQIRIKAGQGDAEAQNNLGMMYANGKGVVQDDKQAAFWFRKAADQGEAMGQFNLGRMYFNGTGVPKDYVQAYLWTNLPAAQELKKAVNMRDSLVKALTPSQIEAGQKLVRKWIAEHPQTAQ